MIGQQTPDSRAEILAKLNASIDCFFGNGGSAQTLPAAGYVPRRPRREPERGPGPIAEPIDKREAARQKRIAEIRELAKTMTYKEAMAHSGLAQSTLVRAAAQGNFKFQRDPNYGMTNLDKKLSDPVEDRSKAEKIIAYRNVGMSRADVVRELQISFKQLGRLLREFEIDFPTIAEKRSTRKA